MTPKQKNALSDFIFASLFRAIAYATFLFTLCITYKVIFVLTGEAYLALVCTLAVGINTARGARAAS
jgi:hypothetical protein